MADKYKALKAGAEAAGYTLNITSSADAYRTYDQQVSCKASWTARGKPKNAATPGTSNHGWGMAVDVGGTGVAWAQQHKTEYGLSNHMGGSDVITGDESWHFQSSTF